MSDHVEFTEAPKLNELQEKVNDKIEELEEDGYNFCDIDTEIKPQNETMGTFYIAVLRFTRVGALDE